MPTDKGKTFHPSVVEARVGTSQYEIVEECPVVIDLDSENKGFEGGAYFSIKGERSRVVRFCLISGVGFTWFGAQV